MFSVHTTLEELKNTTIILDLCLRNIRSGKSHGYRDATVFEKLRFHNFFCPHENEKTALFSSCGSKSVFENLRLRDGSVWTIGPIVVYLSNRLQVSMVYRLTNHAGCWYNTRRIHKSRATGTLNHS